MAAASDGGLGGELEYVSVWLPLVDVGAINGTLTLLPGNRDPQSPCPRCPPEVQCCCALAGEVTLAAAAGTGVAFSSRLWHRSGPNRSPDVRPVWYGQYSAVPLQTRSDGPLSLAIHCLE